MAYRLVFGDDPELEPEDSSPKYKLEFETSHAQATPPKTETLARAKTPKGAKKRPTISFVLEEIERDLLTGRDGGGEDTPPPSTSTDIEDRRSDDGQTFTIFGRIDVMPKNKKLEMRCLQLDLSTLTPRLKDLCEGFGKHIGLDDETSDEIEIYEVIYEESLRKNGDVELPSGRFGRRLDDSRLERGISNGSFFEIQNPQHKPFEINK